MQFERVLRPHVSKVNWFMGNDDRSFWQMHPSSSMGECSSNNANVHLRQRQSAGWSLKMNKNQCYPFIVAVSAIKSTPYKSLLLQTSIQPIIVTFTWTFTGQKYWFHTNLSIHSIHTTKHVSNVWDCRCSEWQVNYELCSLFVYWFPPKIEETKGFEHVSTWNKGGDFIIVI